MSKSNCWTTHVTFLMGSFREALQALIPVVEKVHMRWREPNSYDDWDSICSALFQSIVIGSIESATDGMEFFPLASYDTRMTSYADKSYIGAYAHRGSLALVCLQTDSSPFDTCLFAELDGNSFVLSHKVLKLEQVEFVFVGKKIGPLSFVKDLEVVL